MDSLLLTPPRNPLNYLTESLNVITGFPGSSEGKKSACNAGDLSSITEEEPLEKETATHSSILAWKIPWTEQPVGYSPWGHKESDRTEQLIHKGSYEREMEGDLATKYGIQQWNQEVGGI